MHNLLEKINNITNNGPYGNYLFKGWKPSEGDYVGPGGFGAAWFGSKLRTIRKVGEEDSPSKSKWQSEGVESLSPKSPESFTSLGQWESEWRDPYRTGKEQKMEDVLWNVKDVQEGETGIGAPGEESEYLLGGEQEAIDELETAWEGAETVWGLAETALGTAETEYYSTLDMIEEEYGEDVGKLLRDKSSAVKSGYQELLKSGAAESQAGYATSGPMEERMSLESEATRADLKSISDIRRGLERTKEEDIYKTEQAWSGPQGAQATHALASSSYEGSKASYASGWDKILSDTLITLDTMRDEVSAIGEEDIVTEGEYITSSTGSASGLWRNLRDRQKYSTLMGKIGSMKTGYESKRDYIQTEGLFGEGEG